MARVRQSRRFSADSVVNRRDRGGRSRWRSLRSSSRCGSLFAPDCVTCHSTATWNSGGMPQYITVGGFAITQPPATSATIQAGISNLPHPTVGAGVACTTCHQGTGFKPAIGYDHLSSLINSKCNACHESGSDLVGTRWNNALTASTGAGDTRPYTLASIVSRGRTIPYPNHFYPADCGECHVVPAGNGLTATGAAYVRAWTFPHNTGNMTRPSTCVMCHPNGIP